MTFSNLRQPKTPGTPRREESETQDNGIQWITKTTRDNHID